MDTLFHDTSGIGENDKRRGRDILGPLCQRCYDVAFACMCKTQLIFHCWKVGQHVRTPIWRLGPPLYFLAAWCGYGNVWRGLYYAIDNYIRQNRRCTVILVAPDRVIFLAKSAETWRRITSMLLMKDCTQFGTNYGEKLMAFHLIL